MLPKKNKITKTAFKEAFPSSKFVFDEYFTLKYKDISGNESKVSFITPKSVTKTAVSRNLIKRRGYEAIGPHLKSLKKPYILMFFSKKTITKATFQEIKKSVENLLKKAKI